MGSIGCSVGTRSLEEWKRGFIEPYEGDTIQKQEKGIMILMNSETDGLVLELHDHLHVVRSNLLVFSIFWATIF
jgi:hypothetical protein